MEAYDEGVATAMARANEVFGRLTNAVEAAVREAPTEPIDLLGISREAGLQLNEAVLEGLELPRLVYPVTWLPWYEWWPYEPLWCWWWKQSYPWYRCCPYMLVRRSRWQAVAETAA
jgi:hypothetical protein